MKIEFEGARIKWYLTPVAIVIAILAVGPFAIPLVWISPAFKKWHKIIITIALVGLTIWLVRVSGELYQMLLKEAKELQDVLKQ